jgi:ribose 5-phosphate isomerase A
MAPSADADNEKKLAAEAAAELVEDGMAVGLGTGSTVAFLLPALAARELQLRCVGTSTSTEEKAKELGLAVEAFDERSDLVQLDIAIDGADQIAPDGWIVKGGGGAHVREKIVATAAERFVVIADSSKPVDALGPPIPLELAAFGLSATMREIGGLGDVRRRDAPRSPDGGVIVDFYGEVGDPAELAVKLEQVPGVVGHGLFPPELTSEVIVAQGDQVDRQQLP